MKLTLAIITFCSLASLGLAQEGPTEEAFNLQRFLQQNKPVSMITEMAEQIPSLLLNEVGHGSAADHIQTLSGPARMNGVQQFVTLEGQVALPVLQAGRLFEESYFLIDGPQSTVIRLVSVPKGGVEKLLSLLGNESHPALLSFGDSFAVVDENLLDTESNNLGEASENGLATRGLCIRTPFGPGKVKWNWSNPSSSGYSVKPENSTNLIWAASGTQNVDGVYRSSWGCGVALKIPNSCTVDFYSNGSYSSCCNAALSALGYTVRYVYNEPGFPSCPL